MDAPSSHSEAQQHRRLLVADDDPIQRELMQARLSGPSTSVVCAGDGADAWALLAREQFDLAIIDLGMPRLDGFGLIDHLRQTPRTIDLPIIVATSRDDRDAIERAFAAGATSFITKPINWPLLHYQVQFVLRNGSIERDLRRARIAADTASRTKDNLFRLLSHELRTPLSILVGFSDVLQRELAGRLSDEKLSYLGDMREAASRLNRVVGDVITYSRLSGSRVELTPSPVDANELIENCSISMRAKAREHTIQLVVRPLLDRLQVEVDARLLADALARLADNAIKFSPTGGTVELRANRQEDGSLVLSVRDNGPGMDRRRIEECLQPLVQADMSLSRHADGLGLGLPIIGKIAELHGGRLLIDSAPGEGSVFALWLPPWRCQAMQVGGQLQIEAMC